MAKKKERPEWKIYRGLAHCEVYLHLFSGRRRQHDLAHWIYAMAQENRRHCMAVSADIVHGADLTCQKQFKWWIDQVRKGAIADILGGPPCESWSVSRHKADEDGGPEPIRNSQHPWGKPDLANRLLQQGNTANMLMLAMLEIMVECAIVGVSGLISWSYIFLLSSIV